MSPIRDLVMPHETVVRKLDRMAREMLEVHYQESTLVLIGVDGQGMEVAHPARRLRDLSSMDIVEGRWTLAKDAPLDHKVQCDVEENLAGRNRVFG